VGPLTSDISEATPNPLRAALINSRLALMASPASLANRVASVATPADWPTIRLLLKAIISFFEFPRCLPNPRSVVSLGSRISLATASMVWDASLMADLSGAKLSVTSTGAGRAAVPPPPSSWPTFASFAISSTRSFHARAVSGSSPSSLSRSTASPNLPISPSIACLAFYRAAISPLARAPVSLAACSLMASTCINLSGSLSFITSFDSSCLPALWPKACKQLSINLKTSAGSLPGFLASSSMSWRMASRPRRAVLRTFR
jgi:hypothetical protein